MKGENLREPNRSWLWPLLLFAFSFFVLGPIFTPILHLNDAIDYLVKPFFHPLGLKVTMIATFYSVVALYAGRKFFPTMGVTVYLVAASIELVGYAVSQLLVR